MFLPIDPIFVNHYLSQFASNQSFPQAKRKLVPPPPILQIMILNLSPPWCVISKESVQQKLIDEV